MPSVLAHATLDRPMAPVWAFIRDMDNWAPMLEGYVGHDKQSETDSVWTLTGDLGPFSKTIEVKVHVTEWVESERVAFELDGITEVVSGTGSLELSEQVPDTPPPGWWQRLWSWLLRRSPPQTTGSGVSISFRFDVQAGGPMGPMINPMLGPYADAVAHKLLASVREELSPETGDA